MELTMDVTADSDWAFLSTSLKPLLGHQAGQGNLRLAEHSTPPVRPLSPVMPLSVIVLCTQPRRPERVNPPYLLAKTLNVDLSQLLAGHQALDPAVQGRNGSGLNNWRQSRRLNHTPDILHGGVHCAPLVVFEVLRSDVVVVVGGRDL